MTYPQLSSLLKEVFIEVAERDFRLDDKAQTDSRLSLLTGIHRKDVKRLRKLSVGDEATPTALSLGAQIVSRWTTDPAFTDAAGAPRALPRQAEPGSEGFDSLVESVSRDIRPRSVLDEWLRLGVAHIDDADSVVLDASAFIPSKGFEEKAFFVGRNVADHIAAGAHNLMGGDPPLMERSVYYNHLTAASVAELRALSADRGMAALQDVNRAAMKLQRRDRSRPMADRRLNFGVYVYEEVDPEAAVLEGADEE